MISEVMKHCWASDLKALSDISALCNANGLRFFAVYGTLLGTVRHSGYIPWDDDIDIGMVRDDYIALLDILSDGKSGYEVLNPYTKPWYCMNFSHVTDCDDLDFSRKHLRSHQGSPFVTGPDIYPYYYIPRNPQDEEYILYILAKIDEAMALSRQSVANPNDRQLQEMTAIALVSLQKETGYVFTSDRPMDNQLEILYDQICRLTPPEDADYLTRYDEYSKDRSKKFPKEYLENTILMPFENTDMPVPLGYDNVLAARFGTSYLIPRQEKAAHEYPFFKKQLRSAGNILEENMLKAMDPESDKSAEILPLTPDSRKAIVYHTNIRELIIYSEIAMDKIKSVIEMFADKKDKYNLYWIPGKFLKTEEFAFDEILPNFISEYESYIEECKQSNICHVIKYSHPECFSDLGSTYYGDESLLSEVFEKRGCPVFIQDYTVINDKFF